MADDVIDAIIDAHLSSLVKPFMALVLWDGGSLSYLFTRQFGFARDNKDSAQTSYELDWYQVTFDDSTIYFDVNPLAYRDWRKAFRKVQPKPWTFTIQWSDIANVCFQATDLYASDEIWLKLRTCTHKLELGYL